MLTDAAARYESACRWSLVVCAVIFLFHILTFSPFIGAQVERSEALRQSSMLDTATKEIATVLDAQEVAMKRVRSDLGNLLKRKKADFDRLQWAVEIIRLGSEPGSRPPAVQSTRPEPRAMVQMPLSVQRAAPCLEEPTRVGFFIEAIERAGLTEQVRRAGSGRALRSALRPIVERDVIKPRFVEVHENWRARLPDLRRNAEIAKTRFAQLASQFPDIRHWDSVTTGIDNYLSALDEVAFEPPKDPEWWHSVVGKDEAVLAMEDVTIERISTPSLRRATKNLRNLHAGRKQLVAALDARLAELKQQFEQQKDRLSDLIAPIKGVALELTVVVGNFPIILALLLAAATIWPVRRYSTLIGAAALARRAELIDEPAAETLWRPSGWMRSLALLFGQVVIFIAWILVAAWQLNAWAEREGLDLTLLTASAVLIVVGAGLYKSYILRATARATATA